MDIGDVLAQWKGVSGLWDRLGLDEVLEGQLRPERLWELDRLQRGMWMLDRVFVEYGRDLADLENLAAN
jgi:hypothetical protein